MHDPVIGSIRLPPPLIRLFMEPAHRGEMMTCVRIIAT
jgi:hypothetical protein